MTCSLMSRGAGSHRAQAAFHVSPTSHPSAKRALVAVRCLLKKPCKQAAPLTPEPLRDIHTLALQDDSFVTWRTYWWMSMSFHGVFCWSNLAIMRVKHIHFLPQAIEFTIPKSKIYLFIYLLVPLTAISTAIATTDKI